MKKILLVFIIPFLVYGLSGCATNYDVNYDFFPQTDFTEFKTYTWGKFKGKKGLDQNAKQMVKKIVQRELKAKRLNLTSRNPDLFIVPQLQIQKDIRTVSTNTGDDSDRPESAAISKLPVQELIFDLYFVRADVKKMVWYGSAKTIVDEINTWDQAEEIIYGAVINLLGNYPPNQSSH